MLADRLRADKEFGSDLGSLNWKDIGLNSYGNSLIVNGAFLEKNPKGGQHHVCFEVKDIHEAKAEMEKKGAKVLGEPRIGAHGTPVIFIHPKDSDGVLIELMETPKGAH